MGVAHTNEERTYAGMFTVDIGLHLPVKGAKKEEVKGGAKEGGQKVTGEGAEGGYGYTETAAVAVAADRTYIRVLGAGVRAGAFALAFVGCRREGGHAFMNE